MNSMIEIDPLLFIKCRLCLQDTGQYQIVPKIQDQIKFCFNIEVEPFDGLPQLICKKCEVTLRGYHDTKTVYIQKQEELKSQINLKKKILESQQEASSSPLQKDKEKGTNLFKKNTWRKKLSRISSTSSDSCGISNDDNNYDYTTQSWANSYKKQFECRFCKYKISNKNKILTHVHTQHKQVKEKYHNIFNEQCLVQLQKFDDKPNLTGLNKTVALSSKKIIKHIDTDYLVVYLNKDDYHKDSEKSDDSEFDIIVKTKRKKRRLLSRSTTDTVIIAPDEIVTSSGVKTKEQKVANIECIKVEDSSNSDSDRGYTLDKKKLCLKFVHKHQEAIQNIISVSQNNVSKNNNRLNGQPQYKKGNQSINIESQFQRKILSIGRKIVNKQGFHCTGLLRHMEHNNLEMKWTPKIQKSTTDPDYIRIMTKLRGNVEENDTGWKTLTVQEIAERTNSTSIPISSSARVIPAIVIPSQTIDENQPSQNLTNLFSLVKDDSHKNYQFKRKLNQNAVANPKQLSKNIHIIAELKPNHSKIMTTQNVSNNDLGDSNEMAQNNMNNNLCLPIITSTTSLAIQSLDNSNNNNEKSTNVNNIVNNAPLSRIKVKPVSELMSERVLNNIVNEQSATALSTRDHNIGILQYQPGVELMSGGSIINNMMIEQIPVSSTHEQNIRVFQYIAGVNYMPSLLVQNAILPVKTHEGSTIATTTVGPSKTQLRDSDCVILHTVELPNTKTNSPLRYLENLLQIHGMILIDTKETLDPNFVCLLKFTVQYKQESKEHPVILRLSLFCHKNRFCIKVHDRNQKIIDVRKLSANWQWEIFKVFTGETVPKLFQNAQKENQESQQQPSTSLLKKDEENGTKLLKKSAWRKKRSRISASSSESENDNNDSTAQLWSNSYKKQFECRFCKYKVSNKDKILTHVRTKHKQVKEKYHNIFNEQCLVQLQKFDDKPNLTGLNKTVALSSKKIIKHIDTDYLVVYLNKDDYHKDSEKSDDSEVDIIVKTKRKKRRLLSRSSTDTVIIAPDEIITSSGVKTKEQEVANIECIKVEDSSNSDSDRGYTLDKKKSSLKFVHKHQEAIQNIISVSQNNVSKNTNRLNGQPQYKKENQSVNIESQLQRKILSIGRKIVNKQGFNCTGLLRYMEHNNLEMKWTPKIQKSSTYPDYIRIMTKLRGNVEENDTGWKTLTVQEIAERTNSTSIPISTSEIVTAAVVTSSESSDKHEPNQNLINLLSLVKDVSHNSQHKRKLLNQNPVANPKQLPKKQHIIAETKLSHSQIMITQNSTNSDLGVDIETAQNNMDDNLCLPIITSTTSLAIQSLDNSYNNNQNCTKVNDIVNGAPRSRIKVKPVSELMSERVLNNMANEQSATALSTRDHNIGILQYQPGVELMSGGSIINNMMIEQIPPSSMHEQNIGVLQYKAGGNYIPGLLVQNAILPVKTHEGSTIATTTVGPSKTQLKDSDCVILHTVELPNTKTDSPFRYLENLLQIHGMIIIDTKETLDPSFVCLLKFTVQYKQESKEHPVILRLSLFCCKNSFCIKVHDRNQEMIDVRKLSANWQWEILKVFTGKTVPKLFQNAQKVSNEMFEYAKKFCYLIKSIEFSRIT